MSVNYWIGCIVCVVIGWLPGVSPVVLATEPAIRVGLAKDAKELSIHAADRFTIRLSSGKIYHTSGHMTVKVHGAGLLLNTRAVTDSRIWIEKPRETFDIQVELPAGKASSGTNGKWVVRGPTEILSRPAGLTLINWIDLEEYVSGVVTGEVGTQWPLEALKAQAVAARTYVLYKKLENYLQPFDVVAGVQDQVYHGHSARAESVLQAIAATKGQVVTYDRRPIFAAYSSTAAGPTEDALYVWALDLPYLKGVDCPFDEQAPRYDWRTTFSLEYLEQQLRKAGYDVGRIAT